MNFLFKTTRSISNKLLISILLIVCIATSACYMAFIALDNTKQEQEHLNQQVFPLFSASKGLSQSIYEYLLLDTEIAVSSSPTRAQTNTLQKMKQAILEDITAMESLLESEHNLPAIQVLLDQIFQLSNQLQIIIIEKRPQYIEHFELSEQQIVKTLKQIERQIRLTQISLKLGNKSSTDYLKKIESDVVDITLALGEYLQNSNPLSLSIFSNRYNAAVSSLAISINDISDPLVKKELASLVEILFEQVDDEIGFFNAAESLHNLQNSIDAILTEGRENELEINLLLSELIESLRLESSAQTEQLSTNTQYYIYASLLFIFTIFVVSLVMFKWYIVPNVTRRIQHLSRHTHAVASGDYSIDIDTSGNDELTEMAKSLESFKQSLIAKEEAEQRLIDRELRLSNLFDNAIDGLIIATPTGIVQSFNRACERIFNYSAKDIIGQHVSILFSDELQNISDYLGQGLEVSGKRQSGKLFPAELSVSKIKVHDQVIFSGIVRDISGRKASEQERERLIDKLTDSNEELQRFAFICSHDLQEPLRMIRSFSEKLEKHLNKSAQLDEKGAMYFEFVIDGAKRAQTLISDILDYSRIDGDMGKLESVDTNVLLSQVISNLNHQIEMKDADIEYVSLPIVEANKTQLYQLFTNLISNALKYQQEGNQAKIVITASDADTHWKFSIIDNGIGIEARHAKKIFEVFKRLHHKNEYTGTGIGLSICRKVVSRHGGEIWVESEPLVGSTFHFTIKKHSK